jgi:hypothetical protein
MIPIPLFILDLTLTAFSDLVCLGDSVVPKWKCKAGWFNRSSSEKGWISISALFKLGLQLFRELRKHGRWRMVEVQSGRVRVFVDLY